MWAHAGTASSQQHVHVEEARNIVLVTFRGGVVHSETPRGRAHLLVAVVVRPAPHRRFLIVPRQLWLGLLLLLQLLRPLMAAQVRLLP